MTSYEQRKADEATADRQIIDEAEANGFMACRAIRDALGWDKPGPNGNYYSPQWESPTAGCGTLARKWST